jgi:hypothetical protein
MMWSPAGLLGRSEVSMKRQGTPQDRWQVRSQQQLGNPTATKLRRPGLWTEQVLCVSKQNCRGIPAPCLQLPGVPKSGQTLLSFTQVLAPSWGPTFFGEWVTDKIIYNRTQCFDVLNKYLLNTWWKRGGGKQQSLKFQACFCNEFSLLCLCWPWYANVGKLLLPPVFLLEYDTHF